MIVRGWGRSPAARILVVRVRSATAVRRVRAPPRPEELADGCTSEQHRHRGPRTGRGARHDDARHHEDRTTRPRAASYRPTGCAITSCPTATATARSVIVPGITSPAITWEFVAERLADLARVVVLDLRGAGCPTCRRTATPCRTTRPTWPASSTRSGSIAQSCSATPSGRGSSPPSGRCTRVLRSDDPRRPPLTGPGRDPYPTTRESFEQQLHEAYAGTTADEVRRFYPRWPEAELQLRAEWLPTCDEAPSWRPTATSGSRTSSRTGHGSAAAAVRPRQPEPRRHGGRSGRGRRGEPGGARRWPSRTPGT